jgi:hypothetical protein
MRKMSVDSEAFYTVNGKKVPFSAIRKIDKRKWDTKGVATIYFEEDGLERKTKVDGMVYGQFRQEDGAPAEALFQRIMANFKGELIDYADEEEEENEQPESQEEKKD